MSNPKKELSTWMKAFLYSWINEPSGIEYLMQKHKPKELSEMKIIVNEKLKEWSVR